jgi:hypothetical protein
VVALSAVKDAKNNSRKVVQIKIEDVRHEKFKNAVVAAALYCEVI